MWPLLFLLAVPVIIILYLLKPKGVDHLVSSNLLWQKLLKNQHSKTFFEKFIHNILMYLQILILLLFIISFMSPYINVDSTQGGRVIFLIDTSASMQHDNGRGKQRIEEAIQTACDYVEASRNTTFCVVTNDLTGTELLAVGISDKASVIETLRGITCSDATGSLESAQNIVETLSARVKETGEGEQAHLIVLTDGSGAEDAMFYTEHMAADLLVMGDAVNNIANEFTVYTTTAEGTDVVTQVVNYGEAAASFDVSLYAGEDTLLGVKQMTLAPGERGMCLFEDVYLDAAYLKSVVSGIRFEGQKGASDGQYDSLAADDVSYAVCSGGSLANGVLISSGNTFIERAYHAVTGRDIVKSGQDTALGSEDYNMAVYDAGSSVSSSVSMNRIILAGTAHAIGELHNVRLKMTSGELAEGLPDFNIGANTTYVYEVPEWGHSFITSGDQCVAYYGEHDGIREIVLGFDIRETDFPLLAEFPVFMANAIGYLSDTSLLASNVYAVGEQVVIQPRPDLEVDVSMADTSEAGIYSIKAGDEEEYYVVRIETVRESDGSITAENVTGTKDYSAIKVKQTLRNVFLILAFVLMILEWFLYLRQMNQLKKVNRFYLAIRCISWILLILAIVGLTIPKQSDQVTTIFVVDMSASNQENLREIEQYMADRISEMPANNRYGIVTFGRDAQIEQFLTDRRMISELMTVTDTSATNLEEAVYRAMAMIPAEAAGRIILLTDGRETKGDIINTASAIVSNDIELEGILFDTVQGDDVYVEAVDLPSYLHQGDRYTVEVTVTSNYDTDAEIFLMNGEETLSASSVHLNRGTNRFVFEQTTSGGNMEGFDVVVNAPGDTCAENNAFHAYAMVEDAPKILLLAGSGENTDIMEEILAQAGCNFEVVAARNAPDTMNDLLEYRNIILQNVYLSDLPDGFLEEIESYVRDYGCGLICCGGDNSFALGGYRDSVLEDLLPVDMLLRGVNELPSTAMVMVVDRSGSMLSGYPTNLDMAISAVVEAVRQFRAEDYVGVLSFDDGYIWEVPITLAEDKEDIIERVEGINEGGGTTIKPALQEAYYEIIDTDVSVRHVVLLTDGMGETTDFRDIVSAYQGSGVTLSTVAIGYESDTRLLQQLASSCGGRYYYTDDTTDLPRIFAQEVFLSGDNYLQNGKFLLQASAANEITAGLFEKGWPYLQGYISSTPKYASNTLIISDKQDPILTVWQYGLGKTVAWNTDVTNEWTAEFAGEEDYIQLWKRIIDYSSGNTSLNGDYMDVVTVGDQTTITYEAQDYTGQTQIDVMFERPGGEREELTLHAVSPGRYETVLDTLTMGVYQLSVRRLEDGEIVNAVTTGTAVQFSDEYRFDVSNADVVSYLERYGAIIGEEDEIWTRRTTRAKESYDLTDWLLAALILWFLGDIAVRRFQFVPSIRRRRNVVEINAAERKAEERMQELSGRTAESGQMKEPSGTAAGSGQMKESTAAAAGNGQTKASAAEMQADAAGGGQSAVSTPIEKTAAKTLKKSKKRGRQKAEAEKETLDTAQLLKKKDERNIT